MKKFEKEQKKLSSQLEEERSRHKQLSSMLVLECKKATSKAAEEGQKAGELSLKLEKEKSRASKLEEELAAERKRGLQTEAQVEKQLSEFDIEREQLRAKLNREVNRTRALKDEIEDLKRLVRDLEAAQQRGGTSEQCRGPATASRGTATEPPQLVSVFCQTESVQMERSHGSILTKLTDAGLPGPTTPTYSYAKVNGHCDPEAQTARDLTSGSSTESQGPPREKSVVSAQEKSVENGGCPAGADTPVTMPSHLPSSGSSLSPSSTASSSLTSSPCSSPVLTKRLLGSSVSSPGYQSSYQVGINQRFHAARHKFQSQADQDQQASGLQSPPSRDLSPTLLDNSAAKQLARNTVTQVLSRFTNQGPIKPVSPNSSPFGTDYRNLASTANPRGDASHSPTPGKVSSPLSPLSPGIKSPTIPRAERGNPPPIPPKKPGLTPAQSAATPVTKTHSQASSLTTTEDLASNCSPNAVVANGKDVEILVPTSS